jgi:16S rRNA (cytosine967-C5)-methyltransferase
MSPAAPPRSAPGVSPARACAYAVVRRVFEQGAYADRALHAEARGLDPRERAFAMALAYGTVQRVVTLDHVLAQLSSRPPERLDAPVLAALRLGLMQLLFLHGTAEHAAVHESVELAKRSSSGGAGLVNAVLRRATREGAGVLAALDDRTPQAAAVLRSVPVWLAELWWSELGAERARELLAAVNEPAESALRVNTLVGDPAAVAAELGVPSRPADPPGSIPEGLILDGAFDAFASPLWTRGAIMPQARASMAVARALEPQAGERVLDLCAAPGAKTTHLAALMADEGEIVAVERHRGRAQALQRTLDRMQVSCATVRVADAGEALDDAQAAFDRVLIDPPCSGLGTLQSRPDLRWRINPERITGLSRDQARILDAGAAATRPGGTLVYSVCTISRAESDDVVDAFLAAHPEFVADGDAQRTAPDRDGTDGFFIARLQRR